MLFDEAPPQADSTDPAERRALVALSLVPGVGPSRVRALLARFGSATAALRAPGRLLAAVDGVGPQTAAAIARGGAEGLERAEGHFRAAARDGAAFLARTDPAYPARLTRTSDPPPYLWVRGEIRPEDGRAVAVVGTRKVTDYGRRVAEHFGGGLAAAGLTVVSGLAYGVDYAAHLAALEAGGRTIAVLGSGVDRIYPHVHSPLVKRIERDGQGAVVSEFAPGTAPDASNFPRRNRIIAGLSAGVVVAEARASGGALITAMTALEQDREVFAAPSPLFGEAEGTNRLIRRGWAQMVTGVDDVLQDLAPIFGDTQGAGAPAVGADTTAPAVRAAPPTDLNGIERKLYDALGPEPAPLDSVCDAAGVDSSTALVYLLSLEFKGHARQLAGQQFYRA